MESSHYYKGYEIRYTGVDGTTYVEHFGIALAAFYGMGRIKGEELAHRWVDEPFV